jgi:hypothetical protein
MFQVQVPRTSESTHL